MDFNRWFVNKFKKSKNNTVNYLLGILLRNDKRLCQNCIYFIVVGIAHNKINCDTCLMCKKKVTDTLNDIIRLSLKPCNIDEY